MRRKCCLGKCQVEETVWLLNWLSWLAGIVLKTKRTFLKNYARTKNSDCTEVQLTCEKVENWDCLFFFLRHSGWCICRVWNSCDIKNWTCTGKNHYWEFWYPKNVWNYQRWKIYFLGCDVWCIIMWCDVSFTLIVKIHLLIRCSVSCNHNS